MTYSNEQLCCMWLSQISGIGPVTVQRLMEAMGSASAVYDHTQQAANALTEKSLRNKLLNAPKDLEEVPRKLRKCGASAIFHDGFAFPPLLLTLHDCPLVLYTLGDQQVLQERMVAIVGSRHGTRYGKEVATMIASGLAQNQVVVVSGGARGVDTASHQGALAAGGKTVAVLGCGIDTVYPPENDGLFAKIAQSGCIVSEWAPGMPPLANNFLARNRLIAGMSWGTLLVEAAVRSGAMSTVHDANEYGRTVFAVPGPITSPHSFGPNQLLREYGVCPVLSAADIMADLGWGYGGTAEVKGMSPQTMQQYPLDQQTILKALMQGDCSHDQLIAATGFAPGTLNALLTEMSLLGIIKQLPGNQYAI